MSVAAHVASVARRIVGLGNIAVGVPSVAIALILLFVPIGLQGGPAWVAKIAAFGSAVAGALVVYFGVGLLRGRAVSTACIVFFAVEVAYVSALMVFLGSPQTSPTAAWIAVSAVGLQGGIAYPFTAGAVLFCNWLVTRKLVVLDATPPFRWQLPAKTLTRLTRLHLL